MVMSKLSKWLMSRDCLSNHSNFISWNNVSLSLKSTEFKQIWFVAYLWCFRELNGEKVLLVRREEEMLRDGLPPSSTSSTFNCGMICPPTVHAIPRDCVREGVSIVPWEVQLWTRWGRDVMSVGLDVGWTAGVEKREVKRLEIFHFKSWLLKLPRGESRSIITS